MEHLFFFSVSLNTPRSEFTGTFTYYLAGNSLSRCTKMGVKLFGDDLFTLQRLMLMLVGILLTHTRMLQNSNCLLL